MLCFLSDLDDVHYDTVQQDKTRKVLRPQSNDIVAQKEGDSKGLRAAKENCQYATLEGMKMRVRNRITRPLNQSNSILYFNYHL